MNIVHIDRIYDSFSGFPIGLIGLDDNKKYRYFAFWNENDCFDRYSFREFNPNTLSKSSNLYRHLEHSQIPILRFASGIPSEFISYTSEAIDTHEEYNKRYGFPTDNLTNNKDYLNVSLYATGKVFYDAQYAPVKNNMVLCMSPFLWKWATDKEKKQARMAIIHEIGHMKVSSYSFNDTHTELFYACGFHKTYLPVAPILLPNGDIFHQNLDFAGNDLPYTFALEEIMNDYDCSLAVKGYEPNYPIIGKELNALCDDKLLKARYAHDDEILSTSLLALDDNGILMEEFLLHLRNSVCGDNPKASEKYARRLIQHYSERKCR